MEGCCLILNGNVWCLLCDRAARKFPALGGFVDRCCRLAYVAVSSVRQKDHTHTQTHRHTQTQTHRHTHTVCRNSSMSTPLSDSPRVGCVPYQRYQSLLMSSPEEEDDDVKVKKNERFLNSRKNRPNNESHQPTARDDSSALVATLNTPPASAAATRRLDGRVDTSPTLSPSPATQTLNQLSQQSYGSYLDLRHGSYHNKKNNSKSNNDSLFGMSQLEYDVAATLAKATVPQLPSTKDSSTVVALSPSTGCHDDEETQDPQNKPRQHSLPPSRQKGCSDQVLLVPWQ